MRILVLLVSTFVLAGIGFVVYWTMQGPDGHHTEAAHTTKHPVTLPTSGEGFGPGEKVWWTRYDVKGERTSRIRVSRYKPLKDGRFFVNDPECDFFLSNGQMLHIQGKTGYIVTQETIGRNKNSPAGAPNRAPRSGELKDVTLTLYATEATTRPSMVMTMNNASFDNETYRIQTEDFEDEKGRHVPGDRVPIQARGDADHPDFDGLGLRLQYNDVDRRLEYLKVFHGQRLLIKHPGNFRQPRGSAPTTRPAVVFAPLQPIHGIALAAADKSAVREAVPRPAARDNVARRARPQVVPTTRPKEDHPAPVYRAIFKDDVVISQLEQRLATADEMHVDFVSENDDLMSSAPATQPTTRPNRAKRAGAQTSRDMPAEERPMRTATTTRPTTRQLAAATGLPTSKPSTRPTTNPADEPLEIRWTGPLTIMPVLGDRPDRIAPGEAIVKLKALEKEGRFVEVNREANGVKSTIHAGKLTHWTIDNGALLEESPGAPVEMFDTRGTHIVTRTMLFSEADGTAILYGKSHAELPTEDPAAKTTAAPNVKPELMAVDWLDRCTLYFEGDNPDNLIINRADLVGAVGVKTKQIQLNSDALNLYFAPPESAPAAPPAPATQPARASPALRQLDAFGNVKSILTGPNGPEDVRTLDCDNLKLRTSKAPDGRLYARNVDAIGHVRTKDPKSAMSAGYLHALLGVPSTQPTTKPTTRPGRKAEMDTGELESLVAHDDVHAVMEDGATADASRLDIAVKDGKKLVTLQGSPAIVSRTNGKLIGDIIRIVPETEELSVTGAGRMEGVQRSAPDQPARPVSVKWDKSLLGRDNVIECLGNVEVNTIGTDGSKDVARGRQVILTTTRPTTLPTTQPAANTKMAQKTPATQPIASAKKPTTKPSDFGAIGDREIRSVILDGSATVTSTIADANGSILQQRHLDADRMEFYQDNPKAKRLVIPVPGRMLTLDNRPPSTQPTNADDDPMSMRGALAFQWNKSLNYDEGKQQVVMLGGVQVVRQDLGAEQKMTLLGDTLTADVEPPPQPATKPAQAKTTPPATAPANPAVPMRMSIKKVHVEGNVEVISGAMHVRAETLDYDPKNHTMTARGAGRKRVEKLNERGQPEASFDEFVYDTVKNTVISSKNPVFIQEK